MRPSSFIGCARTPIFVLRFRDPQAQQQLGRSDRVRRLYAFLRIGFTEEAARFRDWMRSVQAERRRGTAIAGDGFLADDGQNFADYRHRSNVSGIVTCFPTKICEIIASWHEECELGVVRVCSWSLCPPNRRKRRHTDNHP